MKNIVGARVKNGLKVLVVASILLSLFAYGRYAQARVQTHQEEIAFYQEIIDVDQAWIAQMQLPSGVLPQRPLSQNTATVIPYFSAMAAMALLENNTTYIDHVTAYLEWMFDRLNDANSDYFSVDGTLSNFTITVLEDGSYQERKSKYDSVDSYAALNISLLLKTYQTTQDLSFFIKHQTSILRIFNALLSTRVDNNLSAVSVGNQTQYLMDNIEVQIGIQDGIELIEQLIKHTQQSEAFQKVYDQLIEWEHLNAKAIENDLWDESSQMYHVGLSVNGQPIVFRSWDRFYPDAVAQLFPMMHRMIDPKDTRAQVLYEQFSQAYQWQAFSYRTEGDFYWTMIGYVAALMEDVEQVKAYLQIYKEDYMPTHAYPLYNAESAWIIFTSQHMIDYHQRRIKRLDPLKLFHE